MITLFERPHNCITRGFKALKRQRVGIGLCASQASPEKQNLWDIHLFIYYEELTHKIMEVEESHSLPPASLRPSKAGGKIPV